MRRGLSGEVDGDGNQAEVEVHGLCREQGDV
jgi:hypothetical protein